MGVIEEIPEKGIVKYAKPAGVIAGLIPVTSPYVTPIGIAIYAIKCKDAVIFSPHPGSRRTTNETVRVAAGRAAGARCARGPAAVRRTAQHSAGAGVDGELRSDDCDRRAADGSRRLQFRQARVRRRRRQRDDGDRRVGGYRRSREELAPSARRTTTAPDARPTATSSSNHRSTTRCSTRLQAEGGYVVNAQEKELLRKAYWDEHGRRTADTIARPAQVVAKKAGFDLPADKTFLIVPEDKIGKAHLFSTEKLGIVLAVFRYTGFDMALDMVRRIFETGGRGHSCGIYSFNDDHIHRLALMAPVSRIMVRQIQSRANAGTFTNGMPMTSSMGCGIWGGNITNENISLKHYMNVTWVSRPIPEDRPSEAGAVRRVLQQRDVRLPRLPPVSGRTRWSEGAPRSCWRPWRSAAAASHRRRPAPRSRTSLSQRSRRTSRRSSPRTVRPAIGLVRARRSTC